jgi:hypothetical protein
MSVRAVGAVFCVVLVACAASAPHDAAPLNVGDGGAPRQATIPTPTCAAAPLPKDDSPADPNGMEPPPPDEDSVSARTEPWSDDPKISACEVTIKTIESATAEVLALPAPSGAPPTKASTHAWDHKTTPVGLDRVKRRFALTDAELAQLKRDGVVVPTRLAAGDWADSLHEVWQSELPLWVSADAVMHAVYASNDRLVARLEESNLAPRAASALATMHCSLGLGPQPPAWPKEVVHDVDLYLTIARSLLAGAPVASMTGDAVDREAKAIVALLEKGEGLHALDVFGRSRIVDFSQYLPRGHYASSPLLKAYFRAAMFLSRFELNLVSRSSRSSADSPIADPRETPREDLDALALAELATSTHADADIAAIDDAWRALAGKREDVSVADLAKLRATAKIASLSEKDAPERLRAAIGNDFKRTARVHPMPEGSSELPAIATLFGVRITPDTFATRPLVHSTIPDRHLIGPMDLAFMLGNDRARDHMQNELTTYPTLGGQLSISRGLAAAPTTTEDLYGPWLTAVRALNMPPNGATPSFMRTTAFADLRIDGTIASYAQLRHNNVLMVGQGYDEGGCEIPDAFVDPVPEVYDALIDYARRGKLLAAIADPDGKMHVASYFDRLGRTLGVLSKIARWELLGQPIPDAAKHWLELVVELRPYGGTGGPPSFTGWWFDLFRLRQEGLTEAGLIVDVFTSTQAQSILYLGVRSPQLGIFVVDTGGPPRVMVGPVANAFSTVGPLTTRYTDADTYKVKRSAPWEATYTIAPTAPPPLEVRGSYPSGSEEKQPKTITFEVRSTRSIGEVTVEALDHHRVVYAAQQSPVGTAWTRFTLPYISKKPKKANDEGGADQIDGIRIKAGGAVMDLARPHQAWTEEKPTEIHNAFGGMKAGP